MAKRLLQWHPAFCAAMRIELEEEADKIRIEEEHLLGEKPMQIDLLIIKKDKTQKIKKNIGQILRANNERMEEKMVPHEVWEKVVLEIGEERGVKIGEARGESRMGQLAEKLIAAGRIPDVSKAARDGAFRQKMYKEFGIEKVI